MVAHKNITFLGDSQKKIRDFPDIPKQRLGYQLSLVQSGETPKDWKPVSGLGKGVVGVKELRERTQDGFYRVIYVANIGDAIYVLHAFTKQSNQIERKDISTIIQRYKEIHKEA